MIKISEKHLMFFLKIAASLLLFICFVQLLTHLPSKSGLLRRPGNYVSPDGRHVLKIGWQDGLVHYTVTEVAGGETLISDGGFSSYHRWFFFWDEQNRLWSYNSDMGPFVMYGETSPGDWQPTIIKADSPLINAMPKPVRDYLPNVIKRHLKLDGAIK